MGASTGDSLWFHRPMDDRLQLPSRGCYSILLGEECYIVEIRSDHGVMYFIVREGRISVMPTSHLFLLFYCSTAKIATVPIEFRLQVEDIRSYQIRGMFRLSNSIPRQVCEIHVRNMIFRAHPGEACFFAWLDP